MWILLSYEYGILIGVKREKKHLPPLFLCLLPPPCWTPFLCTYEKKTQTTYKGVKFDVARPVGCVKSPGGGTPLSPLFFLVWTVHSTSFFPFLKAPLHHTASFEIGCVKRGTPLPPFLSSLWTVHSTALFPRLKKAPMHPSHTKTIFHHQHNQVFLNQSTITV